VQGSTGGLEVVVSMPETLIDRLTRESSHAVTFPARPDLQLDARVREIGPDATELNAYPVTLALTSPPEDLRSGMTAEVELELPVRRHGPSAPGDGGREGTDEDEGSAAQATAVAIPVTAFLASDDGKTAAFVFDAESGTVERRSVEVAAVTRDDAVITDGLSPGDIVATKGLAFLRDGQRVTRLGVGVARYDHQ
jgi:multidrug efflux pump subunit AcrA (membrane-fusion protein)